jgi:hypothetical protein
MAVSTLPNSITQSQWTGLLGPNSSNMLSQNPALNVQYQAYQNAYSTLQPAETAALNAYAVQSQNAANQAIGGLNARGLGRSLQGNTMAGQSAPVSGYGSGALSNLAAQRMAGQNTLAQGYTDQANQLNNGLTSGAYNANNTFNQLNIAQQQLKMQQNAANPLSAGNIVGDFGDAASTILKFF